MNGTCKDSFRSITSLQCSENLVMLRPCNLSKGTKDEDCVLEEIIMYDIGGKVCDCEPPCKEMDYEKLVSSTVWPGSMATIAFSDLYGVNPQQVKEDYLKVYLSDSLFLMILLLAVLLLHLFLLLILYSLILLSLK